MLRLFSFFGLLLIASFTYAASPIITIGISEPMGSNDAQEHTLTYLQRRFPSWNIRVLQLPVDDVRASIEREKPDFLISSASTYLQVAWSLGAHRIVHKLAGGATDVDHAVGSAFIVSKSAYKGPDLRTYKGMRAVAERPKGFTQWLIARGEIELLGYDSADFFSRVLFSQHTNIDVIESLTRGMADIGVLPTCALERSIASGRIKSADFIVINPKTGDNETCQRSTDFYPDIIFSSLPWADATVSKAFTISLLEMDRNTFGFEWSIAHDLNPVLQLMKQLKLPPYEYLNDHTWHGLWVRYSSEISMSLLILLGMVLHILRSNRLVTKRTRELTDVMKAQESLYKKTESYKEKLASLERMSIISYMSNLFAHEIRQPITNILFYASAITDLVQTKRFDDKQLLDIASRITEQANRSNEITNRLRQYAKNQETSMVTVSLLDAVTKVLNSSVPLGARSTIRCLVPADAHVTIDPFELEFIISIFIRNAQDALQGKTDGMIEIRTTRMDQKMVALFVSDNGVSIDDATFNHLGKYTVSNKAQGLGFGLAIASEIAEKYRGHLEFQRNIPNGLTAVLVLPETK